MLGFCFGGTYAFALAAADPRVRAAVPFYGTAPAAGDIAKVDCPVHAFYGSRMSGSSRRCPGCGRRSRRPARTSSATVYPDAGHAFFNDTNPHAYNAADAADAWQKATAFLARTSDTRQNRG